MIGARALAGQPVIIGAGIAGLMTALHLAPEPVVVLSVSSLGENASSAWAQGGIAASMGAEDSPEAHLADTLAAGDGLCDPAASTRILRDGPAAIETLLRLGVRFDRNPEGELLLGLEAAHAHRRIVHACGDGTGREIMRALVAAVRATPSITVLEGVAARRLSIIDGSVAGVIAAGRGEVLRLRTGRVVIATGGVGALFRDTTNPAGAIGHGLVLAARAGAMLANMEFVQFHPTALDVRNPDNPRGPLKLVSEAVRGEGATLIDETGERFLAGIPGAELAPRDVVARAIGRHLAAGHRVFLNARAALGSGFGRRFPAIAALCRAGGIDPATQPIPVRPAAHYHMGGISVDAVGRSTVPGLWACGEVACTGLHGANRLASNSLLEGAVCARTVAADVSGAGCGRVGAMPDAMLPPEPDAAAVQPVLAHAAGLTRDAAALEDAVRALAPLSLSAGPSADPACAALMIAIAALRREESRGAHCRIDFPDAAAGPARPSALTLDEAWRAAAALDEQDRPLRSIAA